MDWAFNVLSFFLLIRNTLVRLVFHKRIESESLRYIYLKYANANYQKYVIAIEEHFVKHFHDTLSRQRVRRKLAKDIVRKFFFGFRDNPWLRTSL